MSTNNTAQSGGIGITGALFLIFLVLKLTGVIAWSWWWVTAPLWIPLGIVALIFLVCGILAVALGK